MYEGWNNNIMKDDSLKKVVCQKEEKQNYLLILGWYDFLTFCKCLLIPSQSAHYSQTCFLSKNSWTILSLFHIHETRTTMLNDVNPICQPRKKKINTLKSNMSCLFQFKYIHYSNIQVRVCQQVEVPFLQFLLYTKTYEQKSLPQYHQKSVTLSGHHHTIYHISNLSSNSSRPTLSHNRAVWNFYLFVWYARFHCKLYIQFFQYLWPWRCGVILPNEVQPPNLAITIREGFPV